MMHMDKEEQKKKWKEMTREQKARYFRDYYLLWTVIFVLAAAAVIYVVWSFVRPKEERYSMRPFLMRH